MAHHWPKTVSPDHKTHELAAIAFELAEDIGALYPNYDVFTHNLDMCPIVSIYSSLRCHASIIFDTTFMRVVFSYDDREDYWYDDPNSIDAAVALLKTRLDMTFAETLAIKLVRGTVARGLSHMDKYCWATRCMLYDLSDICATHTDNELLPAIEAYHHKIQHDSNQTLASIFDAIMTAGGI